MKICNKKWFIVDSEANGNYSPNNEIKFLTNSLESSLCDYSDAYILVAGNITLTRTIGYWPYSDFCDKKLKSKFFKIKLADMSNGIDKKLFEQIFGHRVEKLANKLINTTSKDENQINVNNINNNKDKLYEEQRGDLVIQPNSRRIDLNDAIKLILNFNETIELDLV